MLPRLSNLERLSVSHMRLEELPDPLTALSNVSPTSAAPDALPCAARLLDALEYQADVSCQPRCKQRSTHMIVAK
jgi:hypothetical protein